MERGGCRGEVVTEGDEGGGGGAGEGERARAIQGVTKAGMIELVERRGMGLVAREKEQKKRGGALSGMVEQLSCRYRGGANGGMRG